LHLFNFSADVLFDDFVSFGELLEHAFFDAGYIHEKGTQFEFF